MGTKPLAGLLALLVALAPATPALAQSAPTRAPMRDASAPARSDFISSTGQLHVGETRTGDTETITRLDGSMVVRTIADSTADGAVYDGCQTYYPAGAVVDLATAAKDDDCWDSSQLSKSNTAGPMQFLGWNGQDDPHDDVTTLDQARNMNITSRITMPAHAVTVYAVWANMPVLKYDVNQPDDSKEMNPQPPTTPEAVTGELNKPVSDTSGWTPTDAHKLTGWQFDGWYTADKGGDLYDWSTPLTQAETTVYAHWTRLKANVRYDNNAKNNPGASGAHDPTPGWQYDTITVPADLNETGGWSRPGYRLSSWNTCAKPDGEDPACFEVKPGSGVHVDDTDVTLYAQWTPLLAILPTAGGTGLGPVPWPVVVGLGAAGLVAAIAGVTVVRRRMADAPKHGR